MQVHGEPQQILPIVGAGTAVSPPVAPATVLSYRPMRPVNCDGQMAAVVVGIR
jgi:hypothetical protein